ncbi:MAG: CHRD domain-containing protein [Variovorax sp.]|nr:MAG: CHRD domain-containing protein [Variovorax sp.]
MPHPLPQRIARRIFLVGAALAAAGCAMRSRFRSPEPSANTTPKGPPTWFMADASLLPQEVVPPHTGTAGGSMSGTLTLATGDFRWRVNYARLSGPATLVGFYGPAAKGRNGPLAIQLPPHSQAEQHNTGPDAGYELIGHSTLTPAQMNDLMAGLWYVGISTHARPAGELRGQIQRSTAGVHGV